MCVMEHIDRLLRGGSQSCCNVKHFSSTCLQKDECRQNEYDTALFAVYEQ